MVLEFRSPAAHFVLVPSAIFNMRIARTMDILSTAPAHRCSSFVGGIRVTTSFDGPKTRRTALSSIILWPGPCVEPLCPALCPALCPVHYRACCRVCLGSPDCRMF
ncbi:hypothetical protein ISCGN_004197 [Ixodes scapularis]